MSLDSNPDSRRYHLVARHRIEEANLLLERRKQHDRIYNGSIYLAGFAVECVLKALIMANSTPNERSALRDRMLREFRHDLESLRRETARRGLHMPRPVLGAFRRINTWDNNSRYDPRWHLLEDAELLIAAARATIDWAESLGRGVRDES